MSDNERRDAEDQLVDWLLGEMTEVETQGLHKLTAADAGLAHEAAELRCLFDDMRGLSAELTGRVALAVRSSVDRRLRLRQGTPRLGPVAGLVFCLKVAAVAAVVFGAVLYAEQIVWEMCEADRIEQHVVQAPLPAVRQDRSELPTDETTKSADLAAANPGATLPAFLDHGLRPFYQPFADVAKTPSLDARLSADNALASMRREFDCRFKPPMRRLAIRAAGGSRFLDARIDSLATDIARKIERALGAGTATVQDVALSLRALMAGGSTLRFGDHHRTVRRCFKDLEARVPQLHGGELATALAGLMDVAVEYGGRKAGLVRVHAARLVECISTPPRAAEPHYEPKTPVVGPVPVVARPSMLNWQTTPAQLADAGQVLRLAPAFGVDSNKALRARAYVAAHVAERVASIKSERPDLLAAYLYGFGDLIDREDIELKLRLWRARDLMPEHLVALHHVAWSRFPLRSGWADFQHDLRVVASMATPQGVTDAAALLLALSMNFAAPGSHELLDLAMRGE